MMVTDMYWMHPKQGQSGGGGESGRGSNDSDHIGST